MSKPSKSKTPTLDFFAEAERRREEIKEEIGRVLQQRGWKHTSSTPGCLWMWEKKLPDGRTVLVDRGTALLFERELCGEEYETEDY